jgi:hypothetical protein
MRLPKQLATSNAIRIQVSSSAPVMLALKGTTTAGAFSIPLRIGPGPNTTFATAPAGLTNQTLTLVRTSGNGAANATAVSARGLP